MNMRGVCVAFVGLVAIAGVSYQCLKEKPSATTAGPEAEVTKSVDGGGSSGPIIKTVVNPDNKDAPRVSVAVTPAAADVPKQPPRIMRKRLEPEATRRLVTSPQNIKTVLVTTGRAENANWGVRGMCSFVLNYFVDCDAEVVSKKETAGGEIKVVEKRTFKIIRQDLQLSESDVELALFETLPLDKAYMAVKGVGELLLMCGEPTCMGIGESMADGADVAIGALKAVDGKNVRGLFNTLGVSLPDAAEKKINDFVIKRVNDIIKPSQLEGKSYLITYFQDKDSGAPLRVDFTYADGSEIKTEEERLVLRRANAFMDSKFVPDKSCSPGDTWTVDSSEFDCLFDPYVEGAYCGDVTIERKDNDKDGDWIIGMQPCNVSVRSDNGRTTGELRIESGNAKVDAKNVFVKSIVITGKGSLTNLTPHHLLFKSRFEGDCSIRGTMVTKPINRK